MIQIKTLIEAGHEDKFLDFIQKNVHHPYTIKRITKEYLSNFSVKYNLLLVDAKGKIVKENHHFTFSDRLVVSSLRSRDDELFQQRYLAKVILPLCGEDLITEVTQEREEQKRKMCEKFDNETQKLIDWMTKFTQTKTEATDE